MRIRTELNNQPRVKARLMTRIGSILGRLGSYEQAESLLREAMALRKTILRTDDVEMADSHWRLGTLLRRIDKPTEAEGELRQAITIFEIDPRAHHKKLAGAYNDLGILLKDSFQVFRSLESIGCFSAVCYIKFSDYDVEIYTAKNTMYFIAVFIQKTNGTKNNKLLKV